MEFSLLLGSGGLPFEDRRAAWLGWSGAAAKRSAHPTGHYAALRAQWLAYQQAAKEIHEEGGTDDDTVAMHALAAERAAAALRREGESDGENEKRLGDDDRSIGVAAVAPFPADFGRSVDTIGRDLRRTCQEHHYFALADGLAVLERVLAGMLLHRPVLGYTQGMNYLAAFLLLTLQVFVVVPTHSLKAVERRVVVLPLCLSQHRRALARARSHARALRPPDRSPVLVPYWELPVLAGQERRGGSQRRRRLFGRRPRDPRGEWGRCRRVKQGPKVKA